MLRKIQNLELARVLPTSDAYRAAVLGEQAVWSPDRGPHPQQHPLRRRYQNEAITGVSELAIGTWLRREFGQREMACSLGCGTGHVEAALLQERVFQKNWGYDISEQSLATFRRRLGSCAHTEQADLNFINLPEGAFDLILIWEALHHVINVERLLYQVATALKPEGLLVIRDFVGETRWQWEAGKRKYVNSVVDELQSTPAAPRVRYVKRYTPFALSPFESIRSSELAGCIADAFGATRVLERRFEAVCHDALGAIHYAIWDRDLEDAIDRFVEADRQVTRDRLYRPCTLFGIYGRPVTLLEPTVDAWADSTLANKLDTARYLPPARRLRSRCRSVLVAYPSLHGFTRALKAAVCGFDAGGAQDGSRS